MKMETVLAAMLVVSATILTVSLVVSKHPIIVVAAPPYRGTPPKAKGRRAPRL